MRPFSASILLLSSLCSAVLVHGAPTRDVDLIHVQWQLRNDLQCTEPPADDKKIAETVIHKYAASLKFLPGSGVIHCGAPRSTDSTKREFTLVSSVSETCKNSGCKVIVESSGENRVTVTVNNEAGQTIIASQLTPEDFGLLDSVFASKQNPQ